MIIIYNRYIPFRRFNAINICGIVFARRENSRLTKKEKNHEFIHTLQQREMLFLFFYLWYVAEWIIRIVQYRNLLQAYYHISFEREAYANERDFDYPRRRHHFSWLRYIKRSGPTY